MLVDNTIPEKMTSSELLSVLETGIRCNVNKDFLEKILSSIQEAIKKESQEDSKSEAPVKTSVNTESQEDVKHETPVKTKPVKEKEFACSRCGTSFDSEDGPGKCSNSPECNEIMYDMHRDLAINLTNTVYQHYLKCSIGHPDKPVVFRTLCVQFGIEISDENKIFIKHDLSAFITDNGPTPYLILVVTKSLLSRSTLDLPGLV